MKRFTLILSLLVAMVTTAMGQINYGKGLWTFPATSHDAVTEVPAEIFTDFKEQYKVEIKDEETGEVTSTTYTELTNEKVGVFVTDVRVATEGDVTATFVYNGGNIRMDIGGVDLVNASGEVVYSDYHFGYSGGNKVDNVYTLTGVAVGDYTMRMFIPAQKEDITPATTNDSRGVLTITGAWMYPNEGVYYNIKNVRSNKYVTFKGEGKQFTQEEANNGAGSYWHFVEASLDDVKKWNNAWLEDGAIPAGYKPYWVYSAACEKGVENVTNGNMAARDEQSYPAKIYYIGVHTKDDKTGLIFRPCHEDGSSWNDAEGKGIALGHYESDDAGSLWSIELANVADNDLKAMATTAKNEAIAAANAYKTAYYIYPKPSVVDAAVAEIEGTDVSTVVKALTFVIEGTGTAIVNEIAESATVLTPKDGDRFIMKNKGRTGLLCAYPDGNVRIATIGNSLFALDLVWTLVEAEGGFKLYNERQGVYVGVLNTANNQPTQYTTDINSAGVYEISQSGIYILFHAKGQDGNGYMHLSNHPDAKIVRWDNGDASQWQLFKAPFEITTNTEAPICYTIKTRETYYYTLSGNNIALSNGTDFAENTNKHWFFMLDANKNLKIYSLADKENSMGYITVEGGNTKLTKDHSVANYVGDTYTLYFSDNTNNSSEWYSKAYFAFRPTTGNTFVSNHGGTGHKMGFHDQYNDNGTRVEFECVNSHILKQKVATWEPYIAREGDKLGQYLISDEIKTAINIANVRVSNNDDYVTALAALNAIVYPTINMPETGKYYYLNYKGSYLSNVKETTLKATAEKSISNIFYFEAEGENTYLLDYQNGHYVTNPWNIGVGQAAVNGHATERYKQTKSFVEGGIGYYALKYRADNGRDYYFTVNGGATNSTENLANNEIQCTLEEVTTLPVTISAVGYATFYAPVAVEIPENVKAYYLTSEKVTPGYISLTEIESGVIPANTGVILEAAADTYNFNITEYNDAINSVLTGTVAATYVTEEAYVLSAPNGDVANLGLYTAKLNQVNNTAFKNNSHKAYLPKGVLSPEVQNSNGFRFDFDGTTAVEDVEVENEEGVKVIYDLAGRKLDKVTAPGVYIINGKKLIIR